MIKEEANSKDVQNERGVRIQKLEKLRELGIDPYPHSFDRSHEIRVIREQSEKLMKEEVVLRICGKIMASRLHGGSLFFDLADSGGMIQVYLKKDVLGDEIFSWTRDLVDPGDFLGIEGKLFCTKRGELSILAEKCVFLSKAFRGIPKEWYGFRDVEKRYRERYVDLLINQEARERLLKRTKIVDALRSMLNVKGFLEVETPILQPLYGGANARPFVTHYHALKTEFYLRIADELYLKRLIVGNLEKVYEFSRDFRNEGIDSTHNPEFTMLEVYEAYKNYEDFMDLAQELILGANDAIGNTQTIFFGEKKIFLGGEWKRKSMAELLLEYAKKDLTKFSLPDLLSLAKKHNIKLPKEPSWGKVFDELFSFFVEPNLIDPTFVTEYPVEISPLAKIHPQKKGFTERFELYISGKEIANGFSELNDPLEQRKRFEDQQKSRGADDLEAHPLDEDFLKAQEYGMPPTAGIGIGIDRLAMLLTNTTSIKEVIFFPTLKPIDSFLNM